MATATIIKAYKDASTAYVAATVDEGGKRGVIEYQASTPLLAADGSSKTDVQIKADLTAALSAVRNPQVATTNAFSFSGTITV